MKLTASRIFATLALIAAATPAAARAQADPASTRPLAVGDAVRLVSAGEHYAGTVKRITPDTLVLVAPYRMYTLQRASVTGGEREVSTESRGHAMFRGARYGALGGAAVGLLSSLVLTKDPAGRAFIAADGMILGSLVGGIKAVGSRKTQWEGVDMSYGSRAAQLPAPPTAPAGSQR